MAAGKFDRFWTLVTIILVVIIVIGGIVAWLRYSPGEPLEISIPQSQDWQGNIYIGGGVTNPGIYPFTTSDSIGELIQAAGGTISNDDLGGLELYIPEEEEEEQEVQKININRAEVWLLEALPGIGDRLSADETLGELMCQALRELLLLQSSDWQFLISTASARDYAELRFSFHYDCVRQLISIIKDYLQIGTLSDGARNFLSDCQHRDDLFPELDWRWFFDYTH